MSERKASMGDKVYRGDVVKFIRNNISLSTFMKRTVKTADEACWDLCDKLNYVPAIEEKPEPHWIPVADGLPNIREDVLVSYYDEVMVGWLNDDGTWFAEGFGRLNMNDIAAWMPLPEPFKGVTE